MELGLVSEISTIYRVRIYIYFINCPVYVWEPANCGSLWLILWLCAMSLYSPVQFYHFCWASESHRAVSAPRSGSKYPNCGNILMKNVKTLLFCFAPSKTIGIYISNSLCQLVSFRRYLLVWHDEVAENYIKMFILFNYRKTKNLLLSVGLWVHAKKTLTDCLPA